MVSVSPVLPAEALASHLDDPSWLVADCRFDLAEPAAGEARYREGHIPGAVYVHLDRDLTGPPHTDRGRHPLPSPEGLAATFGRLGVGPDTTVVAYDDAGGPYAARLWWLLRWLGHDAARVLDGGWAAWHAGNRPVRAGVESRAPARFVASPRRDQLVTADQVPAVPRLLDAREPVRYRGEREPLDRVPGHIPGAVNHPWKENLGPDGRFRAPQELRVTYEAVLAGVAPKEAACYCGSGVTACHNLVAMAHAGLAPARLYAGSWSDWITDPSRPIATGARP